MTTHNFFHWLITAFWITIKALPLMAAGGAVSLSGLLVFQNSGTFLGIAVGFPLILLGLSVIFINLYEALASIFDRRFSWSHCPVCQGKLTRF